jgi:TPR repeat protein
MKRSPAAPWLATMSRLAVGAVAVGAAAFPPMALGACGKHSPQAVPEGEGTPSPSASVVTISVGLGACDDLPTCERECDAGSADRCRRLAASYALGNGAPRDEARGTALYERACAMNDAPACVFAGQMHEYAHGVPKDAAAAVHFYERACDLGWSAGCYNLAIMLENGRGIARDRAKAAVLYQGACAAGAKTACDRARELQASPDAGVPR